jgi:hypothetical protein
MPSTAIQLPIWVRPFDAADFVGVSTTTLRTWAEEGCPFLPKGRTLKKKKVPGTGPGGWPFVYWRKDLEAIKARRGEVGASKVPGRITLVQALQKFPRFKRKSIHYWREVGCPYLDGKKLDAKREAVPNTTGDAVEQWTFLVSECSSSTSESARTASTPTIVTEST